MLERYQVLHELGRGATGAVYAARDRTTGAAVALKRFDPALAQSDPTLAGRLLKQVRAARQLRHRNIVAIHDAGEAAGTVYVVMEPLDGESLRALLDRGPLPISRALRIAHEIAGGLAHAHLEGVMHGSLKPSNIVVLRSGAAKITDFGIGQAAPSPEQRRGDPIDHRSDLFALGALLYEMLTGRRPLEGEPPPPSELNPNVPRALDPIVLSMLAAQPAARMPGVPVLLRELERIEEGLGLGSGPSAGSAEDVSSAPLRPQARPEEEPQIRDRMADRDALARHMAIMERESGSERPSPARRATFVALAVVLAALGIGLYGFLGLPGFTGLAGFTDEMSARIERGIAAARTKESPAPPPEASRPAEPLPPVAAAPKAPATEPRVPPASVPRAVEEKKPEQFPLPPIEEPAARAPQPVARAPEEPKAAPVVVRPPPPPPAKAPTQQTPSAKQPEGTARLVLAVSPRGELYINGEHQGATPPITTLELDPGLHRIEVRSGSRKPYVTYMTVEPGDVRRVRHDFNAKALRPPG